MYELVKAFVDCQIFFLIFGCIHGSNFIVSHKTKNIDSSEN